MSSTIDNEETTLNRMRDFKMLPKPSLPSKDFPIPMVYDIWILIINELQFDDLLNLAKTCKTFYWFSWCNCCDKMVCASYASTIIEFRQQMWEENQLALLEEDFCSTYYEDDEINWEAQ